MAFIIFFCHTKRRTHSLSILYLNAFIFVVQCSVALYNIIYTSIVKYLYVQMYIVMLLWEVNLILIMPFALAASCFRMHVWMFFFCSFYLSQLKSSLSSSVNFCHIVNLKRNVVRLKCPRINKVINCMLIISFSLPLTLYYNKALKTSRNKNINDNVFSIFVFFILLLLLLPLPLLRITRYTANKEEKNTLSWWQCLFHF